MSSFTENRDELRIRAKENIAKVQQKNKRGFDKRRKAARIYKEGDLVAIRRTQLAPGMKPAAKYLGPYEIVKALRSNRYIVRKIGEHEGPQQTSSSADFIKPWLRYISDEEIREDEASGENESKDENENIRGRM